jgi:arylsulfatase A-like enzyme
MPTVLELVGLPAPRNCDGHSLLPFCAGETPTGWRDEVCWSFDFRDIQTRHMEQAFGLPSEWCNLQVMRTDKLKYVHFGIASRRVRPCRRSPRTDQPGRHPAKASLRLKGSTA